MPFGMGPLGWMFAPYWSYWGVPYTWAGMPKEQEIPMLED